MLINKFDPICNMVNHLILVLRENLVYVQKSKTMKTKVGHVFTLFSIKKLNFVAHLK